MELLITENMGYIGPAVANSSGDFGAFLAEDGLSESSWPLHLYRVLPFLKLQASWDRSSPCMTPPPLPDGS